ncbi:MAG TPA: DUF3006 domain-containing protein [Haloplasmataceae bacterium]
MSHEKLLIVDRFEGDWAVIEYGKETFDFPKELLPPDTQAGDVLTIQIAVDKETTEARKKQITDLFNRLKKKK